MARNKRKARNEFRYNYSTKHINYIFEEDGRNYHSVGLTHQRKTHYKNKWYKNMPLIINPKKNDNSKSYVRFGIISQNKKSFANKTDKRFKFSKDDYFNVKSKIRNYKKYRKKRSKMIDNKARYHYNMLV